MKRVFAISTEETLDAHDLDLPGTEEPERVGPTISLLSRDVIANAESFQAMKTKVIEEFERAYLGKLLSTHHGNVSKAARAAKKERRAFQRLLRKYGLERSQFLEAA